MCERAAKTWSVPVEQVTYADGMVRDTMDPERCLTCKQIAARQVATGGPIVGSSGVNPPGAGASMGPHIVDVEVDPETGKITILRYPAVQDASKVIHPSDVAGQIQGGAVQGIGWALNEAYVFNAKGHMLHASCLDYRLPVCLDLPMIDTVMVAVPNPHHPYGVRGVGATSVMPPRAAITHAVYHAIGIRLHRLPLSPARILEALWEREAATNGTQGM